MLVLDADNEPPGCPGRVAGCCPARADADLRVDVTDAEARLSVSDVADLASACRLAAAELRVRGEVRVRIVGDVEMAAAHERYSGVAGTTDVLTFDLRTEAERERAPGVMDVDVLVCVDEARRAAAQRGHGPERELLLYVVHAMLHCLGHDDHDEESYGRMHAMEDRVLEAIGVGKVFDVSAKSEEGSER